MPSHIHSITIDCADPAQLAAFWSSALGWDRVEVDEEGATVEGAGGLPRLLFQIVPEGKTVKNRIHLDLQPDLPREEEVQRLIGLGATRLRDFNDESGVFTVMADPESNEFCVERSQAERSAGP